MSFGSLRDDPTSAGATGGAPELGALQTSTRSVVRDFSGTTFAPFATNRGIDLTPGSSSLVFHVER